MKKANMSDKSEEVLLPVIKNFNYDPTYANTILRNNFNREVSRKQKTKYYNYFLKQFINQDFLFLDYFHTEELCFWFQW